MSHVLAVAPLADARLAIPLPSSGLMSRPRVARMLDRATEHPITLVSGGAGTGKTVAVASWAREGRRPGPVAWVSLDAFLSTPTRFWSAVIAALGAALGPVAGGQLQGADADSADLVARLAAVVAGREVVLVLDDVHELGSEVLTGLDQVLRVPPTGLRVVLVTRHDPPLSLNRHRVGGRLADVRVADLSFTAEEVRSLLTDNDLAVPDDVITTLVETSDGWAALLRLAVITMQVADDPVAAGRQFNGQQPMVAGYFSEEVLANLSPRHQEFLVRTGVPGRICAPLATALTGDPASGEVLAELFEGNLLMVELEGSGWYRYHPLLRQMVRARLRQQRPELEPELHRRASRWLEEHGEWLPALEHAIESGDHVLAVQLVLRSTVVAAFTVDWAGLPVLIERIPRAAAPHDPELQVVLAIQAFLTGQDGTTRELLKQAEQGVSALPEPRRSAALLCLRFTQAIEAGRAGDAEAALGAARQSVQLANSVIAQEVPGWALFREAPGVMRGIAEMWAGHPQAAATTLLAVRADDDSTAPARAGIHVAGYVALAEAMAGELEPARERALAAVRATEGAGRPRSHEAAIAWCALAMVRVHQGDEEGALAALAEGESKAALTWPDPCLTTCFQLVRVQHGLLTGDLRTARRWLAEVDRRLLGHPRMTYAVRLRLILGVELALLAGAPHRAQELLDAAAQDGAVVEPDGEADPTQALRLRVLLATGRAQQVVDTVAHEPTPAGSAAAAVWLTVALAHHRLRQDALAADALARSLDAAAPHREILVFRHAGPQLEALLRRHEQVIGTHTDFVRALLPAGSGGGGVDREAPALREPLTERELGILAFLPTMSSNAEIAVELGISVNTVKQHLKSVHRKLGVTSRREAARVARHLDLLPR